MTEKAIHRSFREVARVVLLDANGSVLLVRYEDGRPGRPTSYWATPGGAVERGESHREAAARELREETGLEADIGAELWHKSFDVDFGHGPVRQVERYFLVRLDTVTPAVANSSAEAIKDHRWWSLADLGGTRDVVFPDDLAAALARIV